MRKDLLDTAWKPPRQGTGMVGLSRPRFVERVGYDVDFEEVCRRLAEEAKVAGPERDDATLHKDFVASLVSNHESLWRYWDDRSNLRLHLTDLLKEVLGHRSIDGILERLDLSVVRAMVSERLDAEIRDGKERRIWFRDPSKGMAEGEAWRGPWKIIGWRRAYTGTYYSASHFEEDYSPAGLSDTKAHILLRVEYGKPTWNVTTWPPHIILKGDTHPWESEAVARKMMEEPEPVGEPDGNP